VSRLGGRGGLGAAALAVAVATAFADSSIVVLALPDLLSEFDASIPGVAWTVTAYNLAVAVVALALAAV
jgi:predicted MFS family arabinose efflux permease